MRDESHSMWRRLLAAWQRHRKPYTPERAYRVSVIPLALFLVIGGLFLSVAAVVLPITSPFPFVRSELGNRAIFGAISIFLSVTGIGLWRKSKTAWYAMLFYLVAGASAHAVAVLFDSESPLYGGQQRYLVLGGLLLWDLLIAVGIYCAIAPAFRQKRSVGLDQGDHLTTRMRDDLAPPQK